MLDNVKLLLGISDTSKDDLLNLLISITQDETKAYCNIEDTSALTNIITQIVVIKYNRIGQEGISSTAFNGISESFTDSLPASIIKALNRYRKLAVI